MSKRSKIRYLMKKICLKILFEEDWVIVQYEGSNYPGIVKKETGSVEVSVVQKNNGVGWKWPNKVDQILYRYSDVLEKLPATAAKP